MLHDAGHLALGQGAERVGGNPLQDGEPVGKDRVEERFPGREMAPPRCAMTPSRWTRPCPSSGSTRGVWSNVKDMSLDPGDIADTGWSLFSEHDRPEAVFSALH